jgi:hypothetical protein
MSTFDPTIPTSNKEVVTYINVSTVQKQAAGPLYFRRSGDFRPLEAFVELDTLDGEISFGIRPDHNSVPPAEYFGRYLRWDVRPDVRGSHLVPLAKRLQPLMERVFDGCSDGDHDGKPCTVLDEDALAASDEISSLLEDGGIIDPSDPFQVVEIRTVGDYVDVPPDGLTVKTTDAEIAKLANELESEADSDGIILDGSMIDWLIELRDELRNDAEK